MTLKEAVFKISSNPVLNTVGRFMYFLCERVLGRTFQGFPEIRSAYVSGSMSEGDIVPGLSDIDCVITIDDLGAEEEHKLMTELRRKIRYRMPPFGKDKIGVHVVAYSSAEWSLLGDIFLGKRAGKPRALFRSGERVPNHVLGARVKTLHHLYKAFWKIASLCDSVVKPPGGALARELENRIIERTVTTLDYAVKEGNTPEGYSSLRKSLVESWEALKRTDDESRRIDALAVSLHLFDVAADAASGTEESGADSRRYLYAAVEAASMPPEIAGIVPLVREHSSGEDGVLYTIMHETDIFLFDTANRALSSAIVKYYKGTENRILRIMPRERFQRFFLNFHEQAVIDVCEGKPYTLRGTRDYDVLLLDVYSILPQLRSPRNCESHERYEAFREKAGRILRVLETPGQDGQSSDEGREDRGGTMKDEYGRFTDLKELSQALTAALREFLSSSYGEAHD